MQKIKNFLNFKIDKGFDGFKISVFEAFLETIFFGIKVGFFFWFGYTFFVAISVKLGEELWSQLPNICQTFLK